MASLNAFWSYTRADDNTDDGRIRELAQDVADEYAMLTGDSIKVFLDLDDIQWGEDWRSKIDEALMTTTFFIAVLTPRYLLSSECQRELDLFARKATTLGCQELILPLLYVDIPVLHEASPVDATARLLQPFNRLDWTSLRLKDRKSEDYKTGLNQLAARLVAANALSEQSETLAPVEDNRATVGADEAPSDGLIDRLATTEQTLPMWTETTDAITRDIQLIGEMMTEATSHASKADSQGKGFAARVVIAHNLSQQLTAPVDRIWNLANEFVSQLRDLDDGMRTMIELGAKEARTTPESKPAICGFFRAVQDMSAVSRESFDSTQGMIESVAALEPMSRDLRPPLRRLREALTRVVQAREVTDEWARLISESGLQCDEDGTPAP
jgi:hypothetical protein